MKTKSLHNQLVEWRQEFHMYPELGFEENRTSETVAKLLNEFGLEVQKGIGKTGVIGILKKGSGNKSIGIRADMDALPINETNTFNYISINQGKMHALNIEYIPEAVLKQLWSITKVTLQGKIEKLAKLRLPLLKADIGNPQSFYNSRLKGFLKGSLGSTNVAYRTYAVGGIGGVRIVDYRFQDSAWEQEQRQKVEKLKDKK